MTVRELIIELLECDMNAHVDIDINTEQDSANVSDFDFSIDNRYFSLIIQPNDYVLVDKREFEEMQEQINELTNN